MRINKYNQLLFQESVYYETGRKPGERATYRGEELPNYES